MDWNDGPATEQQLLRLKAHGFVITRPLTVTEAARLIRQYNKHSEGPADPSPPRPVATAPQAPPPARAQGWQSRPQELSESARMHVFRLRAAVENASRAMAASPDGPNVRADFAATTTARREFWTDTCRSSREMQLGSVQVFEFYQNCGSRFVAPTADQVQQVFDALDAAMPTWDKDHPELFYQTLELNYPELVRHP
jgi:hypothetical protein